MGFELETLVQILGKEASIIEISSETWDTWDYWVVFSWETSEKHATSPVSLLSHWCLWETTEKWKRSHLWCFILTGGNILIEKFVADLIIFSYSYILRSEIHPSETNEKKKKKQYRPRTGSWFSPAVVDWMKTDLNGIGEVQHMSP